MISVDFNRLDISGGFRILDIGCGAGRHICESVRYADVLTIGADLSYKDIVEAEKKLVFQERIGEAAGAWRLILSNIETLPFTNGYFDVVICSEVLEHIHNHQKAMFEIVRVLKRGGDLVVTVPRYFPERICWLLSREYRNTPGGHVRIYKKKQLKLSLERFGVRNTCVHYAHGLHSPYWWLKCAVGINNDDHPLVAAYHRFLVWDMMSKPPVTKLAERLLNPLLGKSLVLYFKKNQ